MEAAKIYFIIFGLLTIVGVLIMMLSISPLLALIDQVRSSGSPVAGSLPNEVQ